MGTAAKFRGPKGLSVDLTGNVYVADLYNHKIRKITPDGMVTTLAGSSSGFADDTGAAAKFSSPYGTAVDASGNVYVADQSNYKIRKITPSGEVSTFAGSTAGYTDAIGTLAEFASPRDIAIDALGNLYIVDTHNHKIRKITPDGTVSTLAGSISGFADGIGASAKFNYPRAVAVDATGNVYVADDQNRKIRKITPDGTVSTIAGSSSESTVDGIAANAGFNSPRGIAVGANGNIYVADYGNDKIRKITSGTTLTGDTTGHAGTYNITLRATDAGGLYTEQVFTLTVSDVTAPTLSSTLPTNNATGIAFDANLELTFTENIKIGTGNILLKKASDDSVVETIDIASVAISIIDKILSINPTADLESNTAYYVTIDATAITDMADNAFAGIADNSTWAFTSLETPIAPTFTSTPIETIDEGATYNYSINTTDANGDDVTVTVVSKPNWLSLSSGTNVSTFSGSTKGFANGTGTAAQFSEPSGIAVDAAGNMYVADYKNHKIRKITPAGEVTTLAGSTQGFADGTGTAAQFNFPYGVAVDAAGNVYVADSNNNKIRKITTNGVVTTFAGSTAGFTNGTSTAAKFDFPKGVAVDIVGNVYIADYKNHKIRKITSTGEVTTLAGSSSGFADGTGTAAKFDYPQGVTVDVDGNVYVAGFNSHKIRKITSTGEVTTLAGSTFGFANGTGDAAKFGAPSGIAVDAVGTVYVAEF